MARVIGAIVSLIVGLGALVFIGLGVAVNGSLPRLEGRTIIAGLEAPVAVDRDVEGVPTLAGQNRRDVARALGYLHAQERYFQMDLMRRRAAGLLAELFGEPALAWDRRVRAHQLGHTAGEIVPPFPPNTGRSSTPTSRASTPVSRISTRRRWSTCCSERRRNHGPLRT
jgi:penicillin amidase